jgi:hypothetical protein
MATKSRLREEKPKRRVEKPRKQEQPSQAHQSDPAGVQRVMADPSMASATDVLNVQRMVGNQALGRFIQPSLTIGGVGDQYEQEANQVAGQVTTQSSTAGGQRSVQRQEDEEELQAKSTSRNQDGSFQAGKGLENRLDAEKGRGDPMPGQTRDYMEPRFGADFGGVRIHTDSRASQLNQDLNSRAFTHGQDIYFRSGEYRPETEPGQKLLAHELTHTLQQGASNVVRGWWPAGHKLVTELAFQQGDLSEVYSEDAQKYLIDRSPDIDFIQDQAITMDEGINLGKDRIEVYESLIAAKQYNRAQAMWDNNELHWRDPSYMMSHGEGGRYKQSDPAAVNEAMTMVMVNEAAKKWDWGNPDNNMQALSRLSDALHQAEDRGSHGEGREFTGHDSRLRVKDWAEDHDRELQPWEKWKGAPPEAGSGKWDPDNFSVNKKGGVLGVGFAQSTLNFFAQMIGQPAMGGPIMLNPEEEPKKRSAKFKKALPFVKSGNILGKLVGKSGKGWTRGRKRKALKKLFEKRQELVLSGELEEGEYEKSAELPTLKESVFEEANKTAIQKGFEFYESGAGFGEYFQQAEEQFREWKKSRFRKGGKKKSERIRLAKAYFVEKTAEVKDNPSALIGRANPILKAYEQVFGTRLYPAGKTPWDQLNKMGIQ